MRCLACGSEEGSPGDRCSRCGEEFTTPPPHARPSHVSQVQAALAAAREGRLEPEAAMERWRRFLDLAGGIQERWGAPWSPQLAPYLRPRFGEALAELDAAWHHLEEAAGHVQAWWEGGAVEALEAAEEALEAFFRRSCGGCAWVEKECQELSGDSGAGGLLDVRSD